MENNDDLVQPCGHVHDTMEASAWCDINTRIYLDFMVELFRKYEDLILAGKFPSEEEAENFAKEYGARLNKSWNEAFGGDNGEERKLDQENH